MKLLKIENERAYFLARDGDFQTIDRIVKEDLLRLVNLTLSETPVEFDEFDEKSLPQKAHFLIYKSVVQKLKDLQNRKDEYRDQTDRLFIDAYQRYKGAEKE